jgi:H+/Cl- antiporter ClcA
MPVYNLHPAQMVWAVLAGPLIGVAAVAWVRIIQLAHAMRPKQRGRYIAPVIVFGLLGVVSIRYPKPLGNGKGIIQVAIVGGLSLGLSAVLLVLKTACDRSLSGRGLPGGTVRADADHRGAPRHRPVGDLVAHLAADDSGQL